MFFYEEEDEEVDIIDGSMDPERRKIGFQRQKNEVQDSKPGQVIEFDPRKGNPQIAKRTFSTGATRDSDEGKNDYEGFLSPFVLERYGDYMRAHQRQVDGSMRASDNWQLGIPKTQYVKSLIRHVLAIWKLHRGGAPKPEKVGGIFVPVTMEDALCAVMFNAMGLLHELLTGEGNNGTEVA